MLVILLFLAFTAQGATMTIKKPPVESDAQKILMKKLPQIKSPPLEQIKPPVKLEKVPGTISSINITPEVFGSLKATSRGVWEPQGTRSGTFFILLSEKIWHFEQLMPYVRTYAEDVARDGYKVRLFTVGFEGSMDPYFTDIKNLKAFIRSKWLETLKECEEGKLSKNAFDVGTGLVLIGSFPLPLVHKRTQVWEPESEGSTVMEKVVYEGVFACDLYLTDMDGAWNITDEVGIPLISTLDEPAIKRDSECVPGDEVDPYWTGDTNDWGRMGARPEIWMGRINPGNIGPSSNHDFDAILNYLRVNHNYRTVMETQSSETVEDLTFKNRLIYYDDDMRDLAQAAADMISLKWSGPVFGETSYAGDNHPQGYTRIINGTNTTNKADYKERLKNGNYLWVEAFMHSAPELHEFAVASGTESLHRTELFQGGKLKTLFYYHHGCSACDYKHRDNLGENYLYRAGAMGMLSPMAVLGNTSVGPHDTATFYVSLAYGMNIGQAQMMSQRSYARRKDWPTTYPPRPGFVNPKRYYNQTLLGDPSLRPNMFSPVLVPTPPDLPSVYATVMQNPVMASFKNLNALKIGATKAGSSQPIMKSGLKPGKDYPVRSGGIVRDPLWKTMDIPELQKMVKPMVLKNMADFNLNKALEKIE